ncbi:CusA/CzcA family heavy metal efflux RND transporter [Lewinella sp. W8]|uniref:CusA/CzcA family heavy metal efflux RND transporter n=1 Tax=Lewinella sp. W8 TaxID=2528208 RepID=UPI001068AE79|nr:CusA/CzcA family heavy metal efflux RND transporter [Lewinella sp. W8]MTB50138.1 CusA/CzcA family heavy metal efflux RND transporter [Lewinella sp. W8]
MLHRIITLSVQHKLIVFLLTAAMVALGVYSLLHLPIGAVPDITNNQVQVITTSRDLSAQDVEQFLTYPIELEMANLPGVEEIRSVSKFGLSVVTVVFSDDMGTYLPRQLIAERIKAAEENIPAGFGKPAMGPISTGLGEIYQYILDVQPEYREDYTVRDLREIQDWIVKRQLAGIPGVVEVNTWGGFLKQYEVAIDPEELRGLGITVPQVYDALASNNSVAGGGYIERAGQTYFIRGEGRAEDLEDIRNIIVSRRGSRPVYVRDVATVGFGYANRFGAITGNGEGEKVMGQVMMLKGAGSRDVIEAVKTRVEEISSTLPPGVFINPIVDRSELVGRTTATITENLVLGCLIVVFIVVLLLGNLRSGLVVASIIPLSLLFALSCMYFFGVDANLMSLGAIDFGIIIDGAVIIVEYIAFLMVRARVRGGQAGAVSLTASRDDLAIRGASTMMRSAIFGQLIVMVVFIPILTLSDVEGKMFRPMALVFCFALLGAVLLCLTYVPAMAAAVMRAPRNPKGTFSDRMMAFLERWFTPILTFAMRLRAVVLLGAVLMVAGAAWLFSVLGAEFVPTLDEGDFVIQPVLKTGTPLSETVNITTKIEAILLEFPEVRQVVSRIGAAEVPTDPMSMEESDVIITLTPPDEWTTAETKDELADAFKEALAVIPGMEVEFTQPIEMRFNELITGVRADLAIKIYGEDLDVLTRLSAEIGELLESVPGAADVTVDKISGLPQLSVTLDREAIARYGLNAADVNDLIATAFAGRKAGDIYEGERRYDLVLRYREDYRTSIENIRNAYLPLPGGGQVPLSELARIERTTGPAMIARDDTRRRAVVSVNVRNRDLQSVVEDAQRLIQDNVSLPPGYLVTYGGQFENLSAARDRLLLAIPVALLLIFLLLYFALGSFREALLVSTAIPFSSVGGVLMLWLRGMPFSISAGVGFIALFGIAVLNGIVLIEHFKELWRSGQRDRQQIVIRGTRDRLRAVLLTASSTALGFLPMAISTSAGAEVQRPLATVVIGGLLTATILTLIVVPILYSIFGFHGVSPSSADNQGGADAQVQRPGGGSLLTGLLLLAGALLPLHHTSAQTTLSLEQAQTIAVQQNPRLTPLQQQIRQREAVIDAGHQFARTDFMVGRDELNISPEDRIATTIGAAQRFGPFGANRARRSLAVAQVAAARLALEETQWEVKRDVALAYVEAFFATAEVSIHARMDSLYRQMAAAAERTVSLGESSYLTGLTARAAQRESQLAHDRATLRASAARKRLFAVLNQEDLGEELARPFPAFGPDGATPELVATHPAMQRLTQELQLVDEREKLLVAERKPDWSLEYFIGVTGGGERLYQGFMAGTSIPLSRRGSRAQLAGQQLEREVLKSRILEVEYRLRSNYDQLSSTLEAQRATLSYFEQTGTSLAEELRRTANGAYQRGEVDVFAYLQAITQSTRLELDQSRALETYCSIVARMVHLSPEE